MTYSNIFYVGLVKVEEEYGLVLKSLVALLVYGFLYFVIEKKFKIGEKIFSNHHIIKMLFVMVSFPALSAYLSLAIEDFSSTYYYYILMGTFLFMLNIAINESQVIFPWEQKEEKE